MGVGNKPFLDIKPSDAAINDRAIDYIMKGRGRTRPRQRTLLKFRCRFISIKCFGSKINHYILFTDHVSQRSPCSAVTGARTRASIAVSLFDHSNPFTRAAVSAPVNGSQGPGGPPSSTLLGPLNLHMYSSQTLLPGERPLISPCIEEDELEHETSSQPSMSMSFNPQVFKHFNCQSARS